MANTYILIASNTLGASAASVTFSSIPQTYTDLILKYSARGTSGGFNYLNMTVNGNTGSIYSIRRIMGSGTTASAGAQASQTSMQLATNTIPSQDTNLFSNGEIYIPNYTSSLNKPLMSYAVGERNTTAAYITIDAGLATTTSAISSFTLDNLTSNFVSDSSFYLYGIKNS